MSAPLPLAAQPAIAPAAAGRAPTGSSKPTSPAAAAATPAAVKASSDPASAPASLLPDAPKPSTRIPPAPTGAVRETLHGIEVVDPYRALEQTRDAKVAAWMRAQNQYAREVLGRIEGRDALRDRLEALTTGASAQIRNVHRTPGGWIFYERRAAKEDGFRIYARQGFRGEQRQVFDPASLKLRGKTPAIDFFKPSPDGRLLAVGTSVGGSEESVLRLIDVDSGEPIGPGISRVYFGHVAWATDSTELYVTRYPEWSAGQNPADRLTRPSLFAIKPGEPEAGARLLVAGGDAALGLSPLDVPKIVPLPQGRLLLTTDDDTAPDLAVWHSTVDKLRAGTPDWKPLAHRSDGVTVLTIQRDHVYALTTARAARGRLIAGPLEGFDAATAATRYEPPAQAVLTGIAAAEEGLYLQQREGNVSTLKRLPWPAAPVTPAAAPAATSAALAASEGATAVAPSSPAAPAPADTAPPVDIALPVAGSFSLLGHRGDLAGIILSLEGWTQGRQYYGVLPDGTVRSTGLQPAGPFDAPKDVAVTELTIRSHDGVEVPVSLIHRRGLKRDGSAPTMLTAYAAYGFTIEPRFNAQMLAWVERGGILAYANPRGSGVYGRDWHRAGQMAQKSNSWLDLNAVAAGLIEQRWTSPGRLALSGGSAGGLLVARAMTAQPELYAAVLPAVGVMDAVRFETEPNGVPNTVEFGSVATEGGLKGLLAMSPYATVRDGVRYPGVLLTHGLNDLRVGVWHSGKAAARLQAATSSRRPVLLRLDDEAGHGSGMPRNQAIELRADQWAFALWQMGVKGFGLMTPEAKAARDAAEAAAKAAASPPPPVIVPTR